MVIRCCIWGKEAGAAEVEDMVEEEDVEDMVFDEMFVRRKKRRRSV